MGALSPPVMTSAPSTPVVSPSLPAVSLSLSIRLLDSSFLNFCYNACPKMYPFLVLCLEQLEVVSSFERQHARQSRVWRGVFAGFLLLYAGFLVYSIFQQVRHPWELRFHAYFMDDVDSWMVISADCAAVLACLMAVKGLLQDPTSHPRWLQYSCYTGAFLAIFWLYHMMRLPRFRWDIIWLPVGPFSGALVCLFVEHLLAESLEDIKKLRGSMYYYKTS